jgi:hypothetical protein
VCSRGDTRDCDVRDEADILNVFVRRPAGGGDFIISSARCVERPTNGAIACSSALTLAANARPHSAASSGQQSPTTSIPGHICAACRHRWYRIDRIGQLMPWVVAEQLPNRTGTSRAQPSRRCTRRSRIFLVDKIPVR